MNRLRSFPPTLKTLLMVAMCWTAVCRTALAKAPQAAETGSKAGWVTSYFVVLLGVVLGMLSVCLRSRRRDRARQEIFGDLENGKVFAKQKADFKQPEE